MSGIKKFLKSGNGKRLLAHLCLAAVVLLLAFIIVIVTKVIKNKNAERYIEPVLVSENEGILSVSENDISQNDVSLNDVSGADVSGNDISANDVSGGDSDVSENDVSENEPAPEPEPEPEPEQKNTIKVHEDTMDPFFIKASGPYIVAGSAFDAAYYVSYGDDVDRDLDLKIEGSVDTNTVGDYELKYIITDDVGRSASKKTTVHVVASKEDIPKSQDNTVRQAFSDFVAGYKTDSTMVGIDVSKWQGEVDYDAVKAAGCEFVIMRMGVTAEGYHLDTYFEHNFKESERVGLLRGVYFSSADADVESLRANTQHMINDLNGASLDFPIAFDWENWSHFQDYHLNLWDLRNLFEEFCDVCEANGYTGMMYSSKSKLNQMWDYDTEYTLWLAHYTDQTNYTARPYILWQKGYGRIDGIKGDVDLDVYYPGEVK